MEGIASCQIEDVIVCGKTNKMSGILEDSATGKRILKKLDNGMLDWFHVRDFRGFHSRAADSEGS